MGAKRHVRPISSMPNGKWGNGNGLSIWRTTPRLPLRSIVIIPDCCVYFERCALQFPTVLSLRQFCEAAAGTSADTLYSTLTSILILLRLRTKWTGMGVWVWIKCNNHHTKESHIVTRARPIHIVLCLMFVFRCKKNKTFGDGCCLASTITTNKRWLFCSKTGENQWVRPHPGVLVCH